MDKLIEELRAAKMQVEAGQWLEAEKSVGAALGLVDAVPAKDYSTYVLVREIRSYIAEAGLAALQCEALRAASALDEALRSLQRTGLG
jgi:hypothetical protein